MIDCILIVKIFLVSNLLTNYDPFKWILDAIAPYTSKTTLSRLIFNCLYLTFSCQKCMSLYVGWMLGGWWIGVLSYFISYLYLNLIEPKINRILLPKINFE